MVGLMSKVWGWGVWVRDMVGWGMWGWGGCEE